MNIIYYILLYCFTSVTCQKENKESNDIHGIVADLVRRLDEKDIVISQLSERVRVQDNTVKQLQSTVKQHRDTVDELQAQTKTIEEKLAALIGERLPDLSDDYVRTDADLGVTTGITDGDVQSPPRAARKDRLRRAANESPVAFLATLSHHAQHLGSNQNIAFDNIITNIGRGYNSHGGICIAPITGIYVFSTSILSFRNAQSHFTIKKNGSVLTKMFYYGDALTGFDTTGMTITALLSGGDDIAVVNMDTGKDIFGDHYTSFTGFLLQEVFDDTTNLIG